MKASSVLLALTLMAAPLLSGCFGGDEDEPVPAGTGNESGDATVTRQELAADRGAIAGLLVDDRFRPIPNGRILLQETGDTARANANGEFQFVDLKAGEYTLRATVEGHEAQPKTVDVTAGEYAEIDIMARRVVSEGGHIVTQEFTVFIPCAADFVANGIVWNCLLDLSGDTYRPGFTANYTNTTNVTYLVTEMKANQVGRYTVQVREDDGSSSGGDRYAVARVVDSDYVKIVNKVNETNEEHNGQNNNVPWTNDRQFQTIMFFEGEYKDEVDGISQNCPDVPDTPPPAPNPNCPSRGVGAAFGIKARFVQSLFIGEPDVDIANYRTLN